MKKQILIYCSLIATLSLLLQACGQNKNEQACLSGNCTEASINAPVSPEPVATHNIISVQGPAYQLPAYDPAWGLTRSVYEKAQQKYANPPVAVANTRYMVVIDFFQSSKDKRLYLFDLETGEVQRHLTSHGTNSDPTNSGYATSFSNEPNSLKSALGLYLTLDPYVGVHGYSMRLRGLEDTNSNAEARAIVLHPADYVQELQDHAGRSWGCPAVDPLVSQGVIDKVKSGALLLMDGPTT